MDTFLPLFITALASILAVNWVFPKVLQMAKNRNLVDSPDTRKLQHEPVPVMGGLAVSFGVVVGIFVGLASAKLSGGMDLSVDYSVLLSMIVMLLIGAIDDIKGLSPLTRFILEILVILGIVFCSGICIDSLHGLWEIEEFSWWIAVPLTVIACVGIINAINMIDGVNGLSSSFCILCTLFFGLLFAMSDALVLSIINLSMAASLIPFMIHNVIGLRSKMFIGDAGTMVLGVLISYDVVMLLCKQTPVAALYADAGHCGVVAMVLATLAVPIADTLRVMTMRILRHQSPFLGDKTHFHHLLMDYSHSHTLTTLTEVFIALLILLLWALSSMLGIGEEGQLYVVLLSSMLLMWGGYGYLDSHRSARSGIAWRLRQLFARLRQGETAWWRRMQERVDGYTSMK